MAPSPRRRSNSPVRPVALFAIAAILLSSGCSLMTTSNENGDPGYLASDPSMMFDASATELSYAAVQQAKQSGSIVLHVPQDSDPVRVLPLPRTGQTVRVSDLLRQSGIQAKLSSINVTLYRAIPTSPSGLKMIVRMNDQIVRPESDYALQPGDRIRVTQRRKADALQGLLGPVLGGT